MIALFINYSKETGWSSRELELEIAKKEFKIVGYTEDLTNLRKRGVLCHRAELDNQPIFEGYLSPMWDGDKLRYENQEAYDLLSN